MNAKDQVKVCNAGFTILRADDFPVPSLKFKCKDVSNWHKLKDYPSKAARDRDIKLYLSKDHYIED